MGGRVYALKLIIRDVYMYEMLAQTDHIFIVIIMGCL